MSNEEETKNEAEVHEEPTNSDFTIQDEETRSFAQKIIDKFKALIQEIKSEFDKIIEESKHPAPNSHKQPLDNLSGAFSGELSGLADEAKEAGEALEGEDGLRRDMENTLQERAVIQSDIDSKKNDDRPSTEGPVHDSNNEGNNAETGDLRNHVEGLRQGQNPNLGEGAGKGGSSQPANRAPTNSDSKGVVITRNNGGARE